MISTLDETTTNEKTDPANKLIIQSLARLDSLALGVSVGTLLGLIIFLATNFLVLKGGDRVGPNLVLLSQYFIGFEVTFVGSLIGLFYGFVSGFVLGWLSAFLRNIIVKIYINVFKLKRNMSAVSDLIDHP